MGSRLRMKDGLVEDLVLHISSINLFWLRSWHVEWLGLAKGDSIIVFLFELDVLTAAFGQCFCFWSSLQPLCHMLWESFLAFCFLS